MSQQPTELVPDGIPESVAVGLLRHLEWQADSFSVVFLFADVGPMLALLEWLKRRLVPQGHLLRAFAAPSNLVADPEAWLDSLLTKWPALASEPGSLWALMHLQGQDRRWDQARLRFLARINERRFLLESQVKRPVVLVLPAGFRDLARRMAPDLWHIRASSHVLLASRLPGRPTGVSPGSSMAVPVTDPTVSPSPSAALEDPMVVVQAWRSAVSQGAGRQAYLPLAQAAVLALLQMGKSAEAAEVAAQALALARRRALATEAIEASPDAGSALRDVSVCLGNVGRVAMAQGDWGQAEQAYRECLEISRALVERLGDTPETLRDVSVSLNMVGKVATAQGDWRQAEQAYRESLEIRRALVERQGGTPESLRDVSVSLDNVGRVAKAQDDWGQAEQAYRESLEISRALVERLGATPQSLRDLSVALHKVGQVSSAQGDWGQAEQAYRESLEISRALVERLGGTPVSLRDVSVSLNNLGLVATAQGDWGEAEKAYRESLEIRRALVDRLGDTPESLDDLGMALYQLTSVPQTDTQTLKVEARDLFERLAAAHPAVARYRQVLQLLRNGDNPPQPDLTS